MKRILIVDDDPDILSSLGLLLEDSYEVVLAADGADALAHLEGERFDAVVLDLMMPVMSGDELMRVLAQRRMSVPIIVASAAADARVRSRLLGAADFVAKPFDIGELEDKLARAIASSGGGGPVQGGGRSGGQGGSGDSGVDPRRSESTNARAVRVAWGKDVVQALLGGMAPRPA